MESEQQFDRCTVGAIADFGRLEPIGAVVFGPRVYRGAGPATGCSGVRGVRAGARAHVLPTGEDMVGPPTEEATTFFICRRRKAGEAWARHHGWWRPSRLVATPSTASTHRRCKARQVTLGKFFTMSFSSGFFEWFYSGGKDCGFSSFPTLGLEARKQNCYLFWTMELDLLDLEPVQILLQLLPME
ncbi:hypothetical protein ZWY2020_044658 [Hordeum vulgare]|nr:hypothetical protein ZWY2020_044658 [Hordeum vulgare]